MLEACQLDINDVGNVLLVQTVENDGVIHSIQELRTKVSFEFASRHDDNGVFEIYCSSLTVGQSPIVQHLEQNVENILMRFFDFIE